MQVKWSTILIAAIAAVSIGLHGCSDAPDDGGEGAGGGMTEGAGGGVTPDAGGQGGMGGGEPDMGHNPIEPDQGVSIEPDQGVPIEPDMGEAPPMHSGQCTQNQFSADNERAEIDADGISYQAIAGPTDQPFDVLLVQIKNRDGAPLAPGTYDVAGNTNLADCEICIYQLENYNGQSQRYSRLYIANEGGVQIDSTGTVGDQFSVKLLNVQLHQATVVPNGNGQTELVEGGDTWCAHEYEIEQPLLPQPARLNETVYDFELTNCGTGEVESVLGKMEGKAGMWMIATAGWCPACRAHIPNVINTLSNPEAAGIQGVFILGENSQYQPPTLEYCRQYAATYGNDINDWFIDNDGGSFSTWFQYMWPYLGPDGSFGLPFNAVLRGDRTYIHADRAGTDLNQVINSLLR